MSAADAAGELISRVSCLNGARSVFMFQSCSQMPLTWQQRCENQHILYGFPQYKILVNPLYCQTPHAHGADMAGPNVSCEANSSDAHGYAFQQYCVTSGRATSEKYRPTWLCVLGIMVLDQLAKVNIIHDRERLIVMGNEFQFLAINGLVQCSKL